MSDVELLVIGGALLLVGFLVINKKKVMVPAPANPVTNPIVVPDPGQNAVQSIGQSAGSIIGDIIGSASIS